MPESSIDQSILDKLSQIEERLNRIEKQAPRASDSPGEWKPDSRFEAIFLRATDGILILHGTDYEVELANPAAHQLLGYPVGKLKGIHFDKIYDPQWDDIDEELDDDSPLLRGINGAVLEAQGVRCASGKTLEVDITMNWIEWEGAARLLVTLRDATERRKTEEQAEQMRQRALEASRLKSAFLANMSHEIRTPLNGIIGMTDLLLDSRLSGEQREFADTVRQCGEQLLHLINDILDLSKIEAGKMTLQEGDFNLRLCLEEAMDMIAARAQKKELDLGLLMDPGVPDFVIGDRAKVQQIIINLLSNAVKFTQEGHVVLEVEIASVKNYNVDICFRVRDTGIGIPQEMLGRIFNAFDQVENASAAQIEGTGLGLAISRSLVEMMGGTISVSSRIDEGTVFTFNLPLEAQPHVAGTHTMHRRETLRGTHVLVVDRSEISQNVLTQLLVPMECRVTCCRDLEEAYNKLRAFTDVSMALIDMNTPRLNSEAVRAFKQGREIHLLLTTTATQTEQARELMEAGFEGKLHKPFRRSLVYDAITRIHDGGTVSPVKHDPEEKADRRNVTGGKASLLLAEDDTINQRVATLLLTRVGYTVTVASNGEEALEQYLTGNYDLILMDCQMPVMDGYTATREIRLREEGSERTPIIAMTAFAMQGDREKCLAAGMDGYIRKPVQAKELYDVLETFLFSDNVPRDSQEEEENLRTKRAATLAFVGFADDEPLYDPKALLELQKLVGEEDDELVNDLVGNFISNMPEVVSQMRACLREGRTDECGAIAHMHESRTGNVGARRAQALCHLLQKKIKGGKHDSLEAIVENLGVVVESTTEIFRAEYPNAVKS